MIASTVEELTPRSARPRPTPARALTAPEREAVVEVLHCERVRRRLPGGDLGDAAGRGHLPVLDQDDVADPRRHARRGQGATQPADPPAGCEARAARRAAERAVFMGHQQAQGSGDVDVVLPVGDP
jgi:hypothetical protein